MRQHDGQRAICVFWGPLGQLGRAAMHNIQVTADLPASVSISCSRREMIVFIKPESFVNTEGNGSLIHMGKKAADRYRQLQHYYIISYHIYSRFYRYKETKEIMKLHVINLGATDGRTLTKDLKNKG